MYNIKSCAETVQCTARSLESVYNVERCDSFPLCVFSVCDRVANNLEDYNSVNNSINSQTDD